MPPDSVTVTIAIPAVIADGDAADRARALLILDAVRAERLSWRAAAAALGLAPDQLLDLACDLGIPVTRYEPEDLELDLATLAKLGNSAAAR